MLQNNKLTSLGILSLRDTSFKIPQSTLDLLWLSNDNPSNHTVGLSFKISIDFESEDPVKILFNTCDPSTIFFSLPIVKPSGEVKKLSYYPSYLGLLPEQRWTYLNWLKDTSQPIEIGYVFLYFYGLERQLLIGKFDESVSAILNLRKFHKNQSFLNYSKSSIVYSLIYHNRLDQIPKIMHELNFSATDNIYLHLKNKLNEDLSAQDLLTMSKRIGFSKKVFITKYPERFIESVEKVLYERFRKPNFNITNRYDFDSLPKEHEITFANISFPDSLRAPELPNYFLLKSFTSEVHAVLSKAYEITKQETKKEFATKGKIE